MSIKENQGQHRIEVRKEYPTIFTWLEEFRDGLEKRQDKGDDWTNLRSCAYLEEFQKPKILWADIMRISKSNPHDIPRFAYDESNYYPEATVFMMTGENLKYVLALLNSRLLFYVFVKFYAGTIFDTEGIRYKKAFLENLPLARISEPEQRPFVVLVDRILAAKRADPAADVSTLEAEIDTLVYQLYGLTDEEIAMVEGTM